MTWLSWLDIVASAISAVIATALVLVVLGADAKRAVNIFFGLFALAGAAWAAMRPIVVITEAMNNDSASKLWQEQSAFSFGVMSVCLFFFTVLYINRRSRWTDLFGAIGVLLLIVSLLFTPLRNSLVANVWTDTKYGVVDFKLGAWGYASGSIVAVYLIWCLALFLQNRRQLSGFFPLGVGVLLGGLILRIFFSGLPITSVTAAFSIGIIGYAVVRQQFLNPLRELTTELERKVEERTQELAATAAQLKESNEDLARRSMQMQTLFDLGRAAGASLNPNELMQQAVDLICERFGYYFAGIYLLDTEGQELVLRAGRGEAGQRMVEGRYKLGVGSQSMVGWTSANRQARIVQQASQETIRVADPLLPDTRSEITLPLLAGNKLIGVLGAQSLQENAFSEQDITILQALADQLAAALQNALRFQETQTTLGKAETLYEASRRLATTTTPIEVANAIIASVASTGADGCVVVQFEFSHTGEPEALLYLGAWRRDRAPMFRPGLRLPMSQSPFPFEMVSKFWAVPDVREDESLPEQSRQVYEATDVRALVNIPLQTKDKVIGQVVVLRNTAGPFADTAMRLYEMLSDQAAVTLERASLLDVTSRQAKEEATLRVVGDRVSRAMDVETVLRSAAEELQQALQATATFIELAPEPHAEQRP